MLKDEKKQQIIALGRLGSLRKIQKATRVRRETISAYLRGAGVEIWPPGRWRRERKAKAAIEVITGSRASKPALPGSAGNTRISPRAISMLRACEKTGAPSATTTAPSKDVLNKSSWPSFNKSLRGLLVSDGRRGRTRTCNPRIRNPMLYPFELRARIVTHWILTSCGWAPRGCFFSQSLASALVKRLLASFATAVDSCRHAFWLT